MFSWMNKNSNILRPSGAMYQKVKLTFKFKDQGPVVQSIVSLTSLLRVISLADSIYNTLIFFAEKM